MYFSKYNPFLRENLLNAIRGECLVDIRKYFILPLPTNESTLYIFENWMCNVISLKFSEGLSLDISGQLPYLIEIRESLKSGTKMVVSADWNFNLTSGFPLKAPSTRNSFPNVSLRDLKKEKCIKFLNKKVLDVFLLKGPVPRELSSRKLGRTQFDTNGIGLEFDCGFILVNLSYASISRIIETHFDDDLLLQGVFKKSNTYLVRGKRYNSFMLKDFYLPLKTLNQSFFIKRAKILEESYLDPIDMKNFKVSKPKLLKLIENFPGINVIHQKKFLKILKEELYEKEIGLIDLKFGLNKDLEFRIVQPIDYTGFATENIIFIDSILETLDHLL